MRRRTRRSLKLSGGGLLAVLGLALSITSTNPGSLRANIDQYLKPIGGERLVAGVLIGVACGAMLASWLDRRSALGRADIIDDKEYREAFRGMVESGDITDVRIFGYTGETVLADLIAYEDRYRNLRVRMLHRNWLIEADEQTRHNSRPETSNTRHWDKADAIRRTAVEPWAHAMRRELRYYDGPPSIKGVILSSHGGLKAGFLSFFKWEDPPADGGSPYKGIPKGIVQLEAGQPGQRELLEYAVSQFEMIWCSAKPVEEILEQEGLHNHRPRARSSSRTSRNTRLPASPTQTDAEGVAEVATTPRRATPPARRAKPQ